VTLPPAATDLDAQLPVVARLVVEVRSDGSRTVARGLIEDLGSGERTVIEASADTERALLAVLMRAASNLARLTPLFSMTSWTKRIFARASSGDTKR
jgi:hypothetical protein